MYPRMLRACARHVQSTVLIVLAAILVSPQAHADGKLGIYGIYLSPHNQDARTFSRPGWGVGVHTVVPMPAIYKLLAGTAGFEYVNLKNESITRRNELQLRTIQNTEQNFFRTYLGAEIGPHGRGFLRPHVGVNVAGVVYTVKSEVTLPDDVNPDNSLTQHLFHEHNLQFGFDTTLGVDFNFTRFVVDVGVRYVKSFGVVQQLDNALVEVYPDYFQVYLGVGIGFDEILRQGDSGSDEDNGKEKQSEKEPGD